MAGYVFPTDIVPQTASWGLVRQDVNQPSPLSGAVKRLVRGNAGWRASAEWATLPTREKAQRLSAFLAQAGRGDNVIAFSDPAYTAQGAVSGVLQVAGASQTGSSLTIDGCVASATVFAVGDYFTVGGELKQVTAPCIATSAGAATVYFEPALRASPTDNAFLYVLTPWAPMYMPEGGFSFGHRPPKLSGLSLQFAEAIGSESETVGPYIDLVRGRNDLGAISPLLTVTRASTKYILSAANVLASFATDVAALAWNSSATLLGLYVEPAATNLLLQSQTFDNASWTDVGTPVTTANAAVAPDGTTTAETIQDDSAAASEGERQTVAVANDGTTYCASVYIKATGAPSVYPALNLRFTGGSAVDVYVVLNTQTGATTTNGSGIVASGAVSQGGYWRLYIAVANNTSGNTSCLVTILPAYNSDGTGTSAVAAVGTQTVWGAQLEARAFPTSYIPTTTVAVTRAADAISVSSISTALGFSATEGTLYCEFSMPYVEASAATGRVVWELNDTTTNERMTLRMVAAATDVDVIVVDGGVTQADIDGPAPVANTALKTAVAWRANDIVFYASGASQGADASATLPTMTKIQVGTNSGGSYLGGHIKNLRYYPRRLSAAELATLTT
jgi:hypothetical protein